MSTQQEVLHHYGENVRIIEDPLAMTLLSKLCSPESNQPQINHLVAALYRQLVCRVISATMPTTTVSIPTRMAEINPEAIWRGEIIDPALKAAVVCIARAGIYPSQVCYDFLNEIMDPQGVRQDHMLMNRVTNDSGEVSGAAIHGAKIGGTVDGTTLLIPDPMGATGTTIQTVLDYYRENVEGTPAQVIAINLIITPEYIRTIRDTYPETKIFAFRLDRGLSPKDILQKQPGECWDQEKGLNENGYIVPGGGGFGELMNNSFV